MGLQSLSIGFFSSSLQSLLCLGKDPAVITSIYTYHGGYCPREITMQKKKDMTHIFRQQFRINQQPGTFQVES